MRYPVIVVLAGIGLIGVITLVYDAGWLPLAGPFVAVVAASVIVFVVLLVAQPSTAAARGHGGGPAAGLGPAIAEERRLPAAARPTAASDESLERAAVQVESTLQRLAWAHEQGAAPLLTDLVAADPGVVATGRAPDPAGGSAAGDVVPDGRPAGPDAGRGGPATPLSLSRTP